MNHPVELLAQSYLKDIVNNKVKMDSDVIETIVSDIRDALHRQFAGEARHEFRLRPSNLGRPRCQLWFDKNKPSEGSDLPSNFVINMFLGDVVESVFKGILRAMKVEFKDNGKIDIDIEGENITGEYDLILNGKVDDVKSASAWSYKNKFDSYGSLSEKDAFGYIPQLAIYAKGANVDVGGWWVVNKSNGEFKYISAEQMDVEDVMKDVKSTVSYINNDEPFERCYEPTVETYRNKETGNMLLPEECHFCKYKYDCWETLEELPSKTYQGAKEPPMKEYVALA